MFGAKKDMGEVLVSVVLSEMLAYLSGKRTLTRAHIDIADPSGIAHALWTSLHVNLRGLRSCSG